MQRLRTVTLLDGSAVAGHHAVLAGLLFLMKNYCTMPYKNLRFWHLITEKIIFQKFWYIHFGFVLNITQDITKVVDVVLCYTFEVFTIQALVIHMKII